MIIFLKMQAGEIIKTKKKSQTFCAFPSTACWRLFFNGQCSHILLLKSFSRLLTEMEFRAGNAALVCFNSIPIFVKNFLYAQVKPKRIDQTLPPKMLMHLLTGLLLDKHSHRKARFYTCRQCCLSLHAGIGSTFPRQPQATHLLQNPPGWGGKHSSSLAWPWTESHG